MKPFSSKIFLLLLLSYTLPVLGADYKVKGTVTDSIGNAESFATVRVFTLNDTIHPVKGSVADDAGQFSVSLTTPGSYRVNIIAFGKTPENRDIALS